MPYSHNWGVERSVNHFDIHTPEELVAISKKAPGRIVIRFFRMGCPACDRMVGTWMDMTRREMYKPVTFVSANVEDNEVLAKHYKIERIPTFVCIENGRPVSIFSGADPERLRRMIETGKP
jgi:thioredoxin-like negative regulator of GroEL